MSSSFAPESLKKIADEVAALLKDRKESISVVETAAGGLISAALLSSPGASAIYKGGVTVYTLQSRIQFAGWSQVDIDNYRGPSTQVVSGLAENVRAKLDSTYTVCESGTAGPTGGKTRNRTPGYVALAISSEKGTVSRELDTGLDGDRSGNMVQFAVEALKLAREVISSGETKI